ncbi:MAG: efflux RND transporter permease subunit, partial [Planctomycetota bacterium]
AVRAVVAVATRWRYVTLIVLFLSAGAALYAGSKLKVIFFPSEYQMFFVNLKLAPGASLEETAATLDKVDARIREAKGDDVASTFITAGFYYDFNYQPHINNNYGQIMVTLAEADKRKASIDEVMQSVRGLARDMQIGGASVEVTELNDGPPVGRPVTLRVQAEDLESLRAAAIEVEQVVRATEGLTDVQNSLEVGQAELAARPDDELTAMYGVSAADIGRALATANDGFIATTFRAPDEDWDVRVRLASASRARMADLGAVRVRSGSGARIPIEQVAELSERSTYAGIDRYKGERTATITSDVDLAVTSSLQANRELQRRLAPFLAQHPSIRIEFAGEFQETQKTFGSLAQAFLIALLCMYIILGAQFGSYLQPLVVLTTVPFAVMGVIAGLYFVGDPLTVPVLLGSVGLAGVAVNDAIVLMDFANKRRDSGLSAIAAVREAADLRLRPLLLTTVTTVAGLLPSAIGMGSGGRSVVWGPMATGFSFGMVTATTLTIFFTPALYLIGEDLRSLPRRLRALRGRGPEAPLEDPRFDRVPGRDEGPLPPSDVKPVRPRKALPKAEPLVLR